MDRTTNQNGNMGKDQNVGGMQGIGSPISNEAYNVISALAAKLEGLEAFRKYAKDGDAQVWQQLTSKDVEAVKLLVDQLEQIVKDGKLRLGAPGQAAKPPIKS